MPTHRFTGSLVARILFQPIEESSRVFFSKSLAVPSSPGDRDKEKLALKTAVQLLTTVLLLFTYFLLLLATFLPPYLSLATALVFPPRYLQTSAPSILRAYRFYLPTMAYDGILEAFFASVCTPSDLKAQSRMMAIASVSLVATAVGGSRLLGLGDIALVWANTVSMALRALYAGWFVQRYCASRGHPNMINWRALLPSLGVVVAFAAAGVCTRWSEVVYAGVRLSVMAQKGHIAVGCICLIVRLLSWYVSLLYRRNATVF